MRILIVEDEELAVEKLETMLMEVCPEATIAGRCGSVKETISWLSFHTADLIFLDIQLSDGISFDIFNAVKVTTPVIFTTAYDEYAIKAFQLHSVAYLLKPIRRADLAAAIEKFRSMKSVFGFNYEALMEQIRERNPGFRKRFMVQTGEKIRAFETSEIAYFYVLGKSVFLKSFQGSAFAVDYSLDALVQMLDPERFFRINRKYIVQINAIAGMTAWSRGRIKLDLKPRAEDEFDPVVSIDRAAEFRKWLNA